MTLTKNFLVGMAVAAPLVVGAMAPATAAPIVPGSTISLSAAAATQVSLSGTRADFRPTLSILPNTNPTLISVNAGTGSFASINQSVSNTAANLLATVRDVPLSGGASNTALANFLTGIRIGTGIGPATLVSFDLASWTNVSPTRALFNGILKSGTDSGAAIGELILTGSPSGSGYTMTITAVPTPAVLPAMIGFGLGVVRKRKSAKLAEA